MKRSRAADSVLEHYRQARAPDSAARERMQRGLAQRISTGEPSSVLAQELPRLPPTAAGVAVSPTWLVALGLGVCALLGAAYWLARTPELHAPHVEPARVAQRSAQVAVAPELASPAPAPSIPSALPSAARQLSQRARSRSTAATGGRRAAPPPNAAPAPPRELPAPVDKAPAPAKSAASVSADGPPRQSDLEEEMRLLRAAYAALRAGQPERALDTLAEHASRFPRGELAEARRVARIMALCQAKRVAAARSEAERFLQESPHSPHAARVRSLCVESQP